VGNCSLWFRYILAHFHFCSVTKRAWNIEYKGDAVNPSVQAVHIMNTDRDRSEYDNFVPIVQSLGMGKSRMVDEAAKYIFTLPFNLRPRFESSGTSHHLHSLFLLTGLPRFPGGQSTGSRTFDQRSGKDVDPGRPTSLFEIFGISVYQDRRQDETTSGFPLLRGSR